MADIASTSAASGSTASAAPPAPRKSRGANPSIDYKALFLKSKDKYDRVSTDHTDLITNVTKASAKQLKLREELDYLLDAVASKRAQRARIEQSHRDRALELEREAAAAVAAAAAARHHASSLSYDSRRGSRGVEEYRPYSARYAEPSYPSFGSGVGKRYTPPPPVNVAGSVSSRGERYAGSETSPVRDAYATGSYRGGPSHSPPSRRRSGVYEPERHSSPTRYEGHQRYMESTPPLPPAAAAVKRPRPSTERDLLEHDDGYDMDPRAKRARND